MNSMFLSLFSSIENTLKMIILVMVLVGVFYLCIEIPQLIPVIGGLLAMTIFVLGGLATIESIKYFNAHNITIGEVIDSAFKNDSTAEEVEGKTLTWNMTNLGFKYVNDSTYVTTIEKPFNEAIDLKNNDYILYINDNACAVNNTGSDYVKAQYTYSFYDSHNNLILSDTLYINFGFYKNQTIIELTTNGGENAVNMWKAYQVKNGFMFELKGYAREDVNATKYMAQTTSNMIENTSNDIFTINLFIKEEIDFKYGSEHTSTDTQWIDCLRAESTSPTKRATSSLFTYYKETKDGYNVYSNNFHISKYNFLDIGDKFSNYTNSQLNEMSPDKYSLEIESSSSNNINTSIYGSKVDLSEYEGINPTGMILNIYVDFVKAN